MTDMPVPATVEGQLGWLVGTVGALADGSVAIREEMRIAREERRTDLHNLEMRLVEEFERIEGKVDAVAARTKALEEAREQARGFLSGLNEMKALLLAAAAAAAGWFGRQQT